jgi:hypothetical protein
VRRVIGAAARRRPGMHQTSTFSKTRKKHAMVPKSIVPLLAADAQRITRNYLGSGAAGQSTPKIEPDFVAALVLGAMGDIAAAWTSHLHPRGLDLKLQAVFCHSHPQVTFPPTGSHAYMTKTVGGQTVGQCELADLLLVIDDTTGDPGGNIVQSRRAGLVQAKMLKSATAAQLVLVGNDLAQLDLLQQWPDFKFASPGYDPRTRDFRSGYASGVPITGSSYGVIDKYQSPPNWEHDTPTLPVCAGVQSFGEFFAGLADTGGAATGRAALAGGADDWSFTIDELLSVTGVNLLNLASITTNPTPKRGVSYMAFYQSITIRNLPCLYGINVNFGLGDGDRPPRDVEPRDDEGGISAVRVILSRRPE